MKIKKNKIVQKIFFFLSLAHKDKDYKSYLEKQKKRSITKLDYSNRNQESKNRILTRKNELITLVCEYIDLPKIDHALVIGCRDTTELDILENKGVKNTTGLDLFSNDNRVYIGDMQNMDMFQDKEFDLVYCSHVLEHSYDIEKTVSEIHRISRESGYVVIEVPINFTTNEFDLHDFKSANNLFSIFKAAADNAKILFSAEYKKEEIESGTDIIRLIIHL
jgi:SAM-dependent methyltransferase